PPPPTALSPSRLSAFAPSALDGAEPSGTPLLTVREANVMFNLTPVSLWYADCWCNSGGWCRSLQIRRVNATRDEPDGAGPPTPDTRRAARRPRSPPFYRTGHGARLPG